MRDPGDEPSQETPTAAREGGDLTKILIEMGPLLAFFLTNAITRNIYLATGVFMAAALVAVPISWMREKRLPVVPLITAFFVLLFGGLTLYLRDDLFIKLKPTVLDTLFGSILLGGLLFKREYLRLLLGGAIRMDALGWRKLTLRWGLYFYFLAAANELVHRNVSWDHWVQFKTFGPLILTVLFTSSQLPLMQRHSLQEAEADESEPAGPPPLASAGAPMGASMGGASMGGAPMGGAPAGGASALGAGSEPRSEQDFQA